MKVIVCVKQVPDMESVLTLAADGKWIDEKDLAFRMNEYDEYAVEQSILVKEQLGGKAELTVLSIGPPRAVDVVRKAMAMGVDRGVHIRDDQSSQRDPWQIATMIASYASDKGFDLIFTGMQSQDRGSAQVGVFLAELLGIACITTVVKFSLTGSEAAADRELEGGVKMQVTCALPAVVTCQLGLNKPRYPTLPNIMKARQKELLALFPDDVSHDDARVETQSIYRPERKAGVIVLDGANDEMAETLVAILKEQTAVLR